LKIFDTKLFGLDISQNNTDVRDFQLVDMRNFILDRHGRLVKRPGLRLSNDDNVELYDKELNFNIAKRLKYKQIVTPNKTSIDVFAYANKVYLYNQESNTFQLLYEAPGTAEVDIDTYLGHILVVSHDSNLVILRKLQENVFIFSDSNNKVIRAKGIITGTTIDYSEEDSLTITNMVDIDVDQTNLYSLVSTSEGAQTLNVSPVEHAQTEIETDDIAVNTTNKFYAPISIFMGYDNPHWGKIEKITSGRFDAPFKTGFNEIGTTNDNSNLKQDTSIFKITDENITDFPSGISSLQTYKVKRYFGGRVNHTLSNGIFWGMALTSDSDTGNPTNGITAGEVKINNVVTSTNAIGNFFPAGDLIPDWNETQVFFYEKINFIGRVQKSSDGTSETFSYTADDVFIGRKGRISLNEFITVDGTTYNNGIPGTVLQPSQRWVDNNFTGTVLNNVMIVETAGVSDASNLQDYLLDKVKPSETEWDIIAFALINNTIGGQTYKVFDVFRLFQSEAIYDSTARDVGTIDLSRLVLFYGIAFPTSSGSLRHSGGEIEILEKENDAEWEIVFPLAASKMITTFDIDEINTTDPDVIPQITALLTSAPNQDIPSGSEDLYDFVQYSIRARGFNPYLRFKTPLSNELTEKYYFGNYVFDRTSDPIPFQAGDDDIYKIDITIAAEFTNKGGTGGESADWEYALRFAATNRYKVDLHSVSKDNLDNKDLIASNYYDSISDLKFCKADIFYFFINDIGTNNYLIGVKRSGEENIVTKTLDIGTADAIDLKSFISHTGRRYGIIVYGDRIDLLNYNAVANEIEIIDTFSPTSKTISGIAVTATDKTSDIYIYYTNDTVAKVQVVTDETTSFLKFFRSGSTIVEYTDNDDLDHYITGSTVDRGKLTFINNEQLEKKLLVEYDASAISGGTGYYQWQTGSAAPTSFDKIISDESAIKVSNIKPVTTPARPKLNDDSVAGNLSGTYGYFYIVKEFDSSGDTIYESYPSDQSIKFTVTSKKIRLDLDPRYDPFNAVSAIATCILYLYRYKYDGTAKEVRLTDFRLVTDQDLTEDTGQYKLLTPTTYIEDNISDATLADKEKYRGYSTYYPRCKFVEVYNNVIYQANDNKYPNNIYFSELFDPTAWSPQLALSASEFTNDDITGLIKSDGLYIFTRDEVHLLTGIGLDITKQLLSKQIGCVDARTIQVVDRRIIFLSERGLFFILGYKYEPIDAPVERLTGEFTFDSNIISFFDRANREYKIIYDENKVLSYSFPLRSWFKAEYPYDKILLAFVRENPSTDLWETMFVVENTTTEEGKKFLLLVEDEKINYDHIAIGETQNVIGEIYSKHYDMGNPYTKKIWRKLHLDLVRTHDLECFVSTDDGEYSSMVENVRRKYFNELPYVWLRFDELYGKVRDYGKRGGTAEPLNIKRNVDGKIDRTCEWVQDDSSGVKIRIRKALSQNPAIGFWFNTNNRNLFESQEDNIVLSNDYGSNFTLQDVGLPYTDEDFPSTSDLGTIENPPYETFNPGLDDSGDAILKIGQLRFDTTDIGADPVFTGRGVSIIGGSFSFSVGATTGAVWGSFSTESSGLKEVQVPRNGIGEMVIEVATPPKTVFTVY
jgi:hypothetical protein